MSDKIISEAREVEQFLANSKLYELANRVGVALDELERLKTVLDRRAA